MNHPSAVPDRQLITQLAQVAAYIARPLDYVHDDHLDLAPAVRQVVMRLSSNPDVCPVLNRAASRHLGLSKLAFSDKLHAATEDLRIALSLLHSEKSAVVELAGYCAAVQMYPQIRGCVQKSKRKQIENALGSSAFLNAIREAQIFFPALSDRSRSVQLDENIAINTIDDDGSLNGYGSANGIATNPLIWEGLSTLIEFARSADEACAALLALRFPKPVVPGVSNRASLSPEQSAELKLLLARRGLTW